MYFYIVSKREDRDDELNYAERVDSRADAVLEGVRIYICIRDGPTNRCRCVFEAFNVHTYIDLSLCSTFDLAFVVLSPAIMYNSRAVKNHYL